MKLSERRNAIEVAITRERVHRGAWWNMAMGEQCAAVGRWIDKAHLEGCLGIILSRRVHQLKFDPTFTAAKKVSEEDKRKEMKDCEDAAKELFSGHAFIAVDTEEEKRAKEAGEMRRLPGRKKPVDAGKATNRYCSRRHYHEHLSVMGGKEDDWRKAATLAVATLALESLGRAEAAEIEPKDDDSSERLFVSVILILLGFALIGLGSCGFYVQRALRQFFVAFTGSKFFVYVQALVNDMFPKNMQVPEDAQMLENAEASANANSRNNPLSHDASSVPANLEELQEEENPNLTPLPSSPGSSSCDVDNEMEPAEWDRWFRWKKAVEEEPASTGWRLVLYKHENGNEETQNEIPSDVRQSIIDANYTTSRWRNMMALLDMDSSESLTDFQIRQWHRFQNSQNAKTRWWIARCPQQRWPQTGGNTNRCDIQPSLVKPSECQCTTQCGRSIP